MAERKAFLLRVSPELLQMLQQLAARDMRSLNGEIEYLLWEAVRKQMAKAPPEDQPE